MSPPSYELHLWQPPPHEEHLESAQNKLNESYKRRKKMTTQPRALQSPEAKIFWQPDAVGRVEQAKKKRQPR